MVVLAIVALRGFGYLAHFCAKEKTKLFGKFGLWVAFAT